MSSREEELQKILPYHFRDRGLLKTALIHSSYAHECQNPAVTDNERLEFMGDAVLEVITSDYLYHTYPQEQEGVLSKRRMALVCEENLDRCARLFALQDYLYLGVGADKTGGRNRPSVVSDAMEALIGAVYLDGGFAAASAFVQEAVLENGLPAASYRNSKEALQELLQGSGRGLPEYRDAGSSGPDHNKTYHVDLYIEGSYFTSGGGHSKKAAEQQAALRALEILQEK